MNIHPCVGFQSEFMEEESEETFESIFFGREIAVGYPTKK